MDPVQTKLASLATETMEKLAAKAGKKQGAGAKLWEYVDPDGKKFWLEEKRVSVKSPFTGKTFSSKPQRATPASLGQEIREDSKMPSGPMGDKPMAVKKRKASDDGWGAEEHTAMEHATPESMKKYLHDHPGADPKNHSVKKTKLTPLQQSIKDDLDSRKASQRWGSDEHTAMEHATPESMKKYLHDHPGADPKNHSVKKTKLTPLQQSIKDDLDSRR